ncbi:hypothetical protein [Paenibacillus sp. CMAA1364]
MSLTNENLSTIPHKNQASCWQHFKTILDDQSLLEEYGEMIVSILNSSFFWRAIQRRLDFLIYSMIMNGSSSIS